MDGAIESTSLFLELLQIAVYGVTQTYVKEGLLQKFLLLRRGGKTMRSIL
jgi:hypothetical protein